MTYVAVILDFRWRLHQSNRYFYGDNRQFIVFDITLLTNVSFCVIIYKQQNTHLRE